MRKQSVACLVVAVVAVVALSCDWDHTISVGGDLISRRIDAAQGDAIDIRLWGGALGVYASPPVISSPAVEFLDLEVETGRGGIIGPGGPAQRFRFRARAPGSAVVTFSPLQLGSPTVSDTIVVH